MIIAMVSLRETICKNFTRVMDAHPEIGATEIAKSINVHRSMIYKWRDGVNVPDPDHMDALAKLFRVDVTEFYRTNGESVISLSPSVALRKYLVIPDKVIELAQGLPDDTKIWGIIEDELEREIHKIRTTKRKSPKA
jgi:transcriptional regulator with XRE-family HTH domain